MKVLLLSDINSTHTKKWAIGLANKNIQIGIFSINPPKNNWWQNNSNIQLLNHSKTDIPQKFLQKWQYIRYLPALSKCIHQFQPNILHAHYASSYGLLGALSKFHPYIISVWGSDIYEFPKQFIINKQIVKYNLKNADLITSTSHIMAEKTKKYTSKNIEVIPFGVDIEHFKPIKEKKIFTNNELVIGTVKTLEYKYGIDTLIKSFYLLKKNLSHLNLKLFIVGNGKEKQKLLKLTQELNISNDVIFYGAVDNKNVPQILAEIDIFVALSRYESFGVAVVEAMACEKLIVASNVSGFKEIMINNETGILVEKENPQATASAIQYLIENKNTAIQMAKNARLRVLQNYDFEKNLNKMISIYLSLL